MHRHLCIVVGRWMLRDWRLYRLTRHENVRRTTWWETWDPIFK